MTLWVMMTFVPIRGSLVSRSTILPTILPGPAISDPAMRRTDASVHTTLAGMEEFFIPTSQIGVNNVWHVPGNGRAAYAQPVERIVNMQRTNAPLLSREKRGKYSGEPMLA
jgi:hypothetical protein